MTARLETFSYGKHRERRGDVLHVVGEHAEIGRSPGFPPSVAALCHPGAVGPAGTTPPEGVFAARTVRADGVVHLLACWLELDLGSPGAPVTRAHTRGAYAWAGEAVRPDVLLRALRGAEAGAALRVEDPDPPPRWPGGIERCADQVAALCLEGRPVVLNAPSDDAFLDCWSATWRRVPSRARAYLSGGLRAAGGGRLSLSSGRRPAPGTAFVDLVAGTLDPGADPEATPDTTGTVAVLGLGERAVQDAWREAAAWTRSESARAGFTAWLAGGPEPSASVRAITDPAHLGDVLDRALAGLCERVEVRAAIGVLAAARDEGAWLPWFERLRRREPRLAGVVDVTLGIARTRGLEDAERSWRWARGGAA